MLRPRFHTRLTLGYICLLIVVFVFLGIYLTS